MKKIIALFFLFCFAANAVEAGMVKGYYKKDGTYVAPHYANNSHSKHAGKVKTKVTKKRTR